MLSESSQSSSELNLSVLGSSIFQTNWSRLAVLLLDSLELPNLSVNLLEDLGDLSLLSSLLSNLALDHLLLLVDLSSLTDESLLVLPELFGSLSESLLGWLDSLLLEVDHSLLLMNNALDNSLLLSFESLESSTNLLSLGLLVRSN